MSKAKITVDLSLLLGGMVQIEVDETGVAKTILVSQIDAIPRKSNVVIIEDDVSRQFYEDNRERILKLAIRALAAAGKEHVDVKLMDGAIEETGGGGTALN